jgi:hypothetical protein
MRIPTKEDEERREYEDSEKLNVLKKHAQKELDEINKRKLSTPHNETRIKVLTLVLESERFAGLPIESFPDEVIEEIQNLPFMNDRLIPSIEAYQESLKLSNAKETGKEIERQRAKQRDVTRIAKATETTREKHAVKEKYVTETFLRLINNPTEKKVLEKLSQNKIAKYIQEKVMPDLKNVKTATGKFVLTRTKKIDKDGKPILSGLDIDTIIDIMRNTKSDKIKTNPFKK